ncbi:uncharacterized protein [Montipora capricornis]|uniref:uncharacterized protein n=1 Tax=Montipora capricornis TaxID=246305 RepID=UPI0035F1627C
MIITRPDLKFYKTIKLPLTVLFSRQIPRFSHVHVHVYSMLLILKINIRKQRHLRLLAEPKDGVQLRVRLNNIEEPITRPFSRNALYQEVYDWVGSMEKAPLYFTLHTQGKLIKHTDEVKGNSVVHVAEREAGQVAMLLGSEVSFRGNFEGSKELYATMTDDPTMNSTSGRNQEREGEKVLKKRKDKRATAERKRAKKEKAAKK